MAIKNNYIFKEFFDALLGGEDIVPTG